MKQVPSPNFNARAEGVAVDYIVIHYTGMKTAAAALAQMCDVAAQVSAHYMIDEDGSITQLVDENNRAWHAGVSFWRGITDINSASIGIELVNPGHEFGYRAFPVAQIDALCGLLRGIIERYSMNPATCLLAHSDIAPTRKEDPGELFPWGLLAQRGMGVCLKPTDYAPANDVDITAMLSQIGYDVSALREAIIAFQRRYYAENMSGIADAETVARMRAVLSAKP